MPSGGEDVLKFCPNCSDKNLPVFMDAARAAVIAELVLCRNKIREQRRELKMIGRAHQTLWFKHKELKRERDSWIKSWQNASSMVSRLGKEICEIKGLSLSEYHKYLSGLK